MGVMVKTDKTDKKYYLMYLRKSSESDERQMQSLGDQLKENKELANRLNLNVLKTFSESKSSKQPGRIEFNKMIQLINDRDDIKGIIAWHYNRLSRNPIDTGNLQWLLQSGKIEEIVTTQKTFRLEDSALMMGLEGAMANQYILDLKEAAMRGIKSKIEKGIAPLFAPIGYKNDKEKPKGARDIVPHPDYFPLMRKLFEHYMTGNYSVEGLVKTANTMGLKNNRGRIISKAQMYRDLQNPFYKGWFIYAGEEHKGNHTAMLSEAEFNLIQDILSGNRKTRPQKPLGFALNGFIKCGHCGMSIVGERHIKKYKNGTTQEFRHYRCTKKNRNVKCSQKYIKANLLEQKIKDFLSTLQIDSKYAEWAARWCSYLNEQERDVNLLQKNLFKKSMM